VEDCAPDPGIHGQQAINNPKAYIFIMWATMSR
jgi:hypothetical protein